MDRSRNFSQLHLSGNPVQSIGSFPASLLYRHLPEPLSLAHRLELGAGAPNPANHQDVD